MRLGLLGPAGEDQAALRSAAEFLLTEQRAERVVYLGEDDALERLVSDWAREIVGDDPAEHALWLRAARQCADGSAERIDEFLARERQRTTLRALESLPGDGARTVELVAGRLCVLIFDKALLDEEDMLPASLLVFGKSSTAVVKSVGQRWFVSPGPMESGGIATLDDEAEGVRFKLFDANRAEIQQEVMPVGGNAKLKVSGG
jgi:hypothetical protein